MFCSFKVLHQLHVRIFFWNSNFKKLIKSHFFLDLGGCPPCFGRLKLKLGSLNFAKKNSSCLSGNTEFIPRKFFVFQLLFSETGTILYDCVVFEYVSPLVFLNKIHLVALTCSFALFVCVAQQCTCMCGACMCSQQPYHPWPQVETSAAVRTGFVTLI